jgi:hypothetical protein
VSRIKVMSIDFSASRSTKLRSYATVVVTIACCVAALSPATASADELVRPPGASPIYPGSRVALRIQTGPLGDGTPTAALRSDTATTLVNIYVTSIGSGASPPRKLIVTVSGGELLSGTTQSRLLSTANPAVSIPFGTLCKLGDTNAPGGGKAPYRRTTCDVPFLGSPGATTICLPGQVPGTTCPAAVETFVQTVEVRPSDPLIPVSIEASSFDPVTPSFGESRAAAVLPPRNVSRIFGSDRIATALEIARVSSPSRGANGVVAVIARSDLYPDALAGGPLAAYHKVPLLFTPTGSLDSRVAQWLSERPDRNSGGLVYLLGGTSALSPAVEQAIKGLGFTTGRLSGPDRYATAVAVARELRFWAPGSPSFYLSSGDDFVRTMCVANSAAFKSATPSILTLNEVTMTQVVVQHQVTPVLLSDGPRLPPATKQYLDSIPGKNVFAIGKAGAESGVVTLPVDIGDASLDCREFQNSFGPYPSNLFVITSQDNFPDGLAAATIAGGQARQLIPTGRNAKSIAYRLLPPGSGSLVLGGPSALSDAGLD